MVEVTTELTSTNLHHPAQPPPSSLSWIDEHRRSAAPADPRRPVDPVEPGQRGRGRGRGGGGPATGPHPVSRLPVPVGADGNPRARGNPRATRSGRPWLPARRPVRVPGDQRLLSGDRRRPPAQPGDLRRPHARRHHPAVGSRPGAGGNATGASHRLVPHPPAAAAEPHRTRRRDPRALLRRTVAGDLAARDRSGGARGRVLSGRPGRVLARHSPAVLRAPRPGIDPPGWEEALVRDVEESPGLQSGGATGRADAANAGGEAALGAEVHAGVCEAAAAPTAAPTDRAAAPVPPPPPPPPPGPRPPPPPPARPHAAPAFTSLPAASHPPPPPPPPAAPSPPSPPS